MLKAMLRPLSLLIAVLVVLLVGQGREAGAGPALPGGLGQSPQPPLVRYVSERVPVQGPGVERAGERPQYDAGPAVVPRAGALITNTWQLLATLPGAVVKDVSFPTPLIGYAAAELGQVWKTTDGGVQWTRIVNLGFPYYWYGVHAMDANTVVIAGFNDNNFNGMVRWSTDGGATWTADQVLTTHGWSYRVRFADDLHGLVVDGVDQQAPNRAHYTTDGGRTAADWTPVVPDPSAQGGWFGNQFSLLPNLKARLAGITYCTSPDSGATWGCGPSVDSVFDGAVFFSDDQAGWVGGGSISPTVEGWLHRTTDGGSTWTGRVLSSPWPVREIRFLDSQTGWAAGGNVYSAAGGMYFSSDGGQTWALDMSTGAEMDACDAQPLGTGQQQVWCIGYYGSGNFSSKVYSTIYGGVTVTPTPTAIATQTASQTPMPTSTSTSPPTFTPTLPPTYSPSATQPEPTASATNTGTVAPTDTQSPRTPTPTQCAMTFVDVPPGSTFYGYVRCLACRGIISGYQGGTFRPNNNVTRGQLSKIISNSAGYSDPQPVRTFEDVPVGSTFQVYIGRLASRGYIGGYPCGGAGEPCVPPANLPYFRPANPATRGQLAKIVCHAYNCAGSANPHGLVINEVYDSQIVGLEYFELYNTGTSNINLSTYVIYNHDGNNPLSTLDDPNIAPGQIRTIGPAQLHKPTIAGSGLVSTDFLGLVNTSPSDATIDVVNWGNAPDTGWPNYERFAAYFFVSGTQPTLPEDGPNSIQRWPDGYDTNAGSDWAVITRSPADFSCADPYESDNWFATASIQNPGTTNLHRICPADDSDFIQFTVSSAYTYTLRATAVGTRVDTILRLYDVANNLLIEDDPSLSHDSMIVFHPEYSGLYRVDVQDHGYMGGSGSDFLYNFTIARQGEGTLRTFEDVPPGSTFYTEIEQLHALGAINGYPCGRPGEPCVPPDNRPYFRPNADVTRGQTAKIVANTFFPDCQTP